MVIHAADAIDGTLAELDAMRDRDGFIPYCPVCRRPGGTSPLGPLAAMGKVARHLADAHPFYADLLALQLTPARQSAGDPFYPAEDRW